MRSKLLFIFLFCSGLLFLSLTIMPSAWLSKPRAGYTLFYTMGDTEETESYCNFTDTGIEVIKKHFGAPYPKSFNVYVHPHRNSMDSSFQKAWNVPGFRSECWMVASGDAYQLHLLSPQQWERQACEHRYADSIKTRRLITHELVHVYHGQLNGSPDFSAVEGLDWFVEGLATYISGQCDSIRLADVKKAIADRKVPDTLDAFWTGNLKYGLSGSAVLFIDKRYGRAKLKELLPFTKKTELLRHLNTTEAQLLTDWKNYVQTL